MATRAVLFDFGGTLYDYGCLADAEAQSLMDLARAAGIDAAWEEVAEAHRQALREAFRRYLPQPYYLHRDMFAEAVVGMLQAFGKRVSGEVLDSYRQAQWQGHARDFELRAGVVQTLQALRERGLHLGIVSNIDDDQLDHLLAVAGLRPHFDSILSSQAVRSCKPHAAIFAAALERAGCAGPEALFVGDTLRQDIAGANQAGMRSVLLWHRPDRQPPPEGPQPRHVINAIPQVLDLVTG